MKNNYLFRTDIRIALDDKKQEKWLFSMIIPYYLPVNDDEKLAEGERRERSSLQIIQCLNYLQVWIENDYQF